MPRLKLLHLPIMYSLTLFATNAQVDVDKMCCFHGNALFQHEGVTLDNVFGSLKTAIYTLHDYVYCIF